eukprot:g25613.t1
MKQERKGGSSPESCSPNSMRYSPYSSPTSLALARPPSSMRLISLPPTIEERGPYKQTPSSDSQKASSIAQTFPTPEAPPTSCCVSKAAVVLVAFLDTTCQCVGLLSLSVLLLDIDQGFLPSDTPASMRILSNNVVRVVYYLAWFLGASFVSKLSDSIGRKAGLVLCLAFNLLGVLATLLALHIHSYVLLCVSRGMSAFMSGTRAISAAALIDCSSSPIARTQHLSLLLAALSIGQLAGSVLSLPAWPSLYTPFALSAGMLAIALLLTLCLFHDSPSFTPQRLEVRVSDTLTVWAQVVRRPPIARLSFIYLLTVLSLHIISTKTLCNIELAQSAWQACAVATAVLWLAVATLVAVGGAGLVDVAGRGRLVLVSLLCIAVVPPLLFLNSTRPTGAVALIAFLGGAYGLFQLGIITMFSLASSDNEQGWVMGVTVSLVALVGALVSLESGRMAAASTHLPYLPNLLSGTSALLSFFFALFFFRNKHLQGLVRSSEPVLP